MKLDLARSAALTALLIATFASAATAESFEDRFEKTIDVEPGVDIQLRNTNGNVEISTWDREAVEIIAEKRVRSSNDTEAREALEAIEIRVDESTGRVDIETHLPSSSSGFMSWIFGRHVNASVNYEIRIPASAKLDVVTINGSVYSDGPTGDQTLRSTNGRITVERAQGTVDARTTNGSIELELVQHDAVADIDAATTNGSITLRLPTDIKARLEARTVNGSVRTDIPVTISGSNSKRRLNGELNGGGDARIALRTTNGSIRVRES